MACIKCTGTTLYATADLSTCTTSCLLDIGTYSDGYNCKLCNLTMSYCKSCSSNNICTECILPYYLKSDKTSCIATCANEAG